MELLAWVAEAQLYSLSRLRRDERAAYAALLGLAAEGDAAARGILWADRHDPSSPVLTFARSMVLPADTVINVIGEDAPTFRPAGECCGRPAHRQARHASRRRTRHRSHRHERARRRHVLPLRRERWARRGAGDELRVPRRGGLFGAGAGQDKTRAVGDRISRGAASERRGCGRGRGVRHVDERARRHTARRDTGRRRSAHAAADRRPTRPKALLTTGTLLLDLAGRRRLAAAVHDRAACDPRIWRRPPRALRIEPNVIPIQQGRSIEREPHLATGEPDWSFTLDVPGLRFGPGEEPDHVSKCRIDRHSRVDSPAALCRPWSDDEKFEFDHRTGHVTFGNGVNGRIPRRAQVLVSYAVSDGERGQRRTQSQVERRRVSRQRSA